ncbi:MAG TPA: hypothetical protein VFS40_09695 [Gemmatimonadales bacterium]|nr:hypothetical protein [Gemmatimonadales bacterium]
MNIRPSHFLRNTTLAVAAAMALAGPTGSAAPAAVAAQQGYAPRAEAVAGRAGDDSLAAKGAGSARLQGSLTGLLSVAGLPPVAGALELSREALVFHPHDASDAVGESVIYPLYFVRRTPDGAARRRSAVTLLGVAGDSASPVYLFHLDGGVFETAEPGVLAELAEGPVWLDSLGATRLDAGTPLVDPRDTVAVRTTLDTLIGGAYADSLFQLFGRPERPVGLVGTRGASAARLGEYIASRDSLSLSPDRMTSAAQLRHTLAHELAHRWQRRAAATVRTLWRGVGPITDSLRYGYGHPSEQQAEAVAFAIHFLQTTARPAAARGGPELLTAYERLVPGTRAMAAWLLARPLYARHPLASRLLAGATLDGFEGTE